MFTSIAHEQFVHWLGWTSFDVWLGGAVCLFSLGCGLLLGFLDKRAARILKKQDGQTGLLLIVGYVIVSQ